MKRFYFIIIAFLLCSAIAHAKFCMHCGENLPDLAQFCSKCGSKQAIANKNKESIESNKAYSKALSSMGKRAPKALTRPLLKINAFYRAKTNIFLYEKRGDEKNALKKNIFFKPRRHRLKRNSSFNVIEIVGDSCLVQSKPNKNGNTIQGWVYNTQLSLRSDWVK